MIAQYNILVVEDSNFVRMAVRRCLLEDQDPIAIKEAHHGKHALEILAKQSFDLILTDLEMPEMNGLELISHLRCSPQYEDVPIIFLTSVDTADKKVEAFESGATDYVLKPFTAPELKARLMAHLERKIMREAVKKKVKAAELMTRFYRKLKSIDLDELETMLLDFLLNSLKIGSASLWAFEGYDQALRLKIASDRLPEELEPQQEGDHPMWTAMKAEDPKFFDRPNEETVLQFGFNPATYSGSAIMSLPLFVGDSRLGILNLTNFPSDFYYNYETAHLEAIQHYLSNALNNAQAYNIIHAQQQQTQDELKQARDTQLSVLPQKIPKVPFLNIVSKYLSMDQIGGDLYDVLKLSEDKLGILVADVTGHGIPAALISCMSSSLFKAFTTAEDSPEVTLALVNDQLDSRIPEGKFVTAFYCTYDAPTHTLTYSLAGHPAGYVIRPSVPEIFTLGGNEGLPLGVFGNDIAEFIGNSFTLQQGDKVFLFTDGIVEMTNHQEEMFGEERLESFLLDNSQLAINVLLDEVYYYVLSFSQKLAFNDDITLVAFEITQ